MIDRGDIRRNRPLQQYLASLPGAGYVVARRWVPTA